MTTYYIESGDLRTTVEATSPISAAGKALSQVTKGIKLGYKVLVNPHRFLRGNLLLPENESALALETGTLLRLLSEHEL